MSEFSVGGWASVSLDATVENNDDWPDQAQKTEALADAIDEIPEDELREQLKADIEVTHSERTE